MPASTHVRFAPYVFLHSKHLRETVMVRLSSGLLIGDVAELLAKLSEEFEETPTQALRALGRDELIGRASDWEYAQEPFIGDALRHAVAVEKGVAAPPDDEEPPQAINEFAPDEGDANDA